MSVTAAKGFTAAGVTCGLKDSGKPDLAVVHNLGPEFAAAGVFTSNRVQAAPVRWSRQVLDGSLRAVILNSGGANACTGHQGYAAAEEMATLAGTALGVAPQDVGVCSTGLIGVQLPMELLRSGIPTVCHAADSGSGPAAATAIMTTDTVAKQAVASGAGWTVGGMAKGAGMLAPGLATMLVVLTTDALVEPAALQQALTSACAKTFDRIDSDGCMSTNDTVIMLANGASGVRPAGAEFSTVVTAVCHDLAQQLLHDAEGASHDIAIEVMNAGSEEDALVVARTIARNNLFKCAIFGNDPNWGRVLAAVGTTAVPYDPDRLDVSFNQVMVCRGGEIGEDRSLVDLTPRQVHVGVDLHTGNASATVWTNDLTYDYVKENAEYST